MNSIILKKNKQQIPLNKHPWIFSGAIQPVTDKIIPGEIAAVITPPDKICAYGTYNPNSNISVRIISWGNIPVTKEWFYTHIKDIAAVKENLLGISGLPETKKNYRVIFSDADNVPGLIIDRYGTVFVLQLQTLFSDINRQLWIDIIQSLWQPSCIYERSDVVTRKQDGLKELPAGILSGSLPGNFTIEENNFNIMVDIPNGQKTGYFLDLRQFRKRIEYWCGLMKIRYLQNYFAYTGSFNLFALRSGVNQIDHIEISKPANIIAKNNLKLNRFDDRNVQIIPDDCFNYLSHSDSNNPDAIILDPPSFVRHKEKIKNAIAGYERLNCLALKKLAPGGLLFSLCCSSHIDERLFQQILFRSAALSNSKITVLEKIGHDIDHTYNLYFPESRYLQGWILYKS